MCSAFVEEFKTMDIGTFRQEVSGTLYAQNLMLCVLLTDYMNHRLPDKGEDTEHLDALVGDLEKSFLSQLPKMHPIAAAQAKKTIFDLLGASSRKYWDQD